MTSTESIEKEISALVHDALLALINIDPSLDVDVLTSTMVAVAVSSTYLFQLRDLGVSDVSISEIVVSATEMGRALYNVKKCEESLLPRDYH